MLYSDSSNSSTGTSIGTWGFVIFFLLLFWFWGGAGFNRGMFQNGMVADAVSDNTTLKHTHDCAQRNERDVLEMATTLSNKTADITKTLAAMQYESKSQTERILDGQKDLYIKDLERIATQQFITGQTTTLTNRMDNLEASSALQRSNDNAAAALQRANDTAAAALQRQADYSSLSAQISNIANSMLTKPEVQACCGLPSVTCTNTGSGCGCSGV